MGMIGTREKVSGATAEGATDPSEKRARNRDFLNTYSFVVLAISGCLWLWLAWTAGPVWPRFEIWMYAAAAVAAWTLVMGIAIVSRRLWGYYVFLVMLIWLTCAYPIGTLIARWSLRFILSNSVRDEFTQRRRSPLASASKAAGNRRFLAVYSFLLLGISAFLWFDLLYAATRVDPGYQIWTYVKIAFAAWTLAIAAGIFARRLWGYYLFISFLKVIRMLYPLGTIVGRWSQAYMESNSVKDEFERADRDEWQ